MTQHKPSALLLERQGGVMHVRLHRPQVRNAMSQTMLVELLDTLAQAEKGGVRVIVLRGSGGHFSAGADLKDMSVARATPIAHHSDPIAETNAKFGHVCAAYSHSPLAIVAVLEGAVMGGAFGLSCAADVAIASHTVDFRLPETSLGVIPAQIAPFLVERLGYAEAKRLAVTGARFGAGEAYRIGLVHKVCENSADLQVAIATTMRQILPALRVRLRKRKNFCGARALKTLPPSSSMPPRLSPRQRAARKARRACAPSSRNASLPGLRIRDRPNFAPWQPKPYERDKHRTSIGKKRLFS